MNEDCLEIFWPGDRLDEEEKGNTLKFVDAESNNWNEREGHQRHVIDRQGRMEKKNK